MDCRPYAVTCSQGNPVILPEVFVRIKKEDYSNLYGSVKEETRNAHIKGGLVFNPDTLLWIKQVDDPEITRHKDSQTQVMTEPDVVAKVPTKRGPNPETTGTDVTTEKVKKRRPKFTASEVFVLVTTVLEHYDRLFGAKASKTPFAEKIAIWQIVLDNINSVGVMRRGMEETKKRWHDYKRRLKEKVADIRKQASNPEGGPLLNIHMTPLECRVADLFQLDRTHTFRTLNAAARSPVAQEQLHELQSNRQLKQQAARSPVGDRYSGTTSTSGPDDTFGDPVEGTSQAHEKHSVSLCMTSTVCRDSLSSDEEDTISDPPTPQQVSSRSVLHQESSLQTHQSQLIKHMESQTSTLRSVDKNLKRLVSAPVCLGKHLKDLSKQVGCLSASLKMFKNDMLAIQTSHNTCLETFATIMENQQASMQRMEDILSQMSMNNCAHGSSTSINQPQVTSHVEITSTSSPVALRSIRPLRRATQNIDVPFKKSKQK
ncbi:uncharacterized protein LOC142467290 isoform X2 [Ascaphus truei]